MSNNGNLRMDSRPRMVSVYELLSRLLPLMQGYTWAEDALMDLWKLGAPDPSHTSRPCPPGSCRLKAAKLHECTPKWGCAMEKRVLLPQQFAKWWQDVAQRQGLDLTAEEALAGKGLHPELLAKKFGSAPVVRSTGEHSGTNGKRHR